MKLTLEQHELITSHLWLAESIASVAYRRQRAWTLDEITCSAYYGLCIAASNYREGKAKFATYATHRIHGQILDDLKIWHGRNCSIKTVSLIDQSESDGGPRQDHSLLAYRDTTAEESEFWEEAFRNLKGRNLIIAEQRFRHCEKQADIGRRFGVLESRANQIISRILELIRKAWRS